MSLQSVARNLGRPCGGAFWSYAVALLYCLFASMAFGATTSGCVDGESRPMITAGGTVVVDAKGRVWSIGADRVDDEHSEESPVSQTKPVQIEGLTDIVSAAPGIALRKDGQVFVWGKIYGRIRKSGPDEIVWSSSRPVPLEGASDSSAIASSGTYGEANYFVVRKDGSVWAFGNNRRDALGFRAAPRYEGADEIFLKLHRLSFIDKKVVRISSYASNHIALAEDGTIYVWGKYRDRLGLGELRWGADGFGGFVIEGGFDICDVVAGLDSSYAIKRDGSVHVWGRVKTGLFAYEDVQSARRIESVREVVRLASGVTTLFLDRSGSIWAAGKNSNGELGIGIAQPPFVTTPVHLPVAGAILSIDQNSHDHGAIDALGRVWVWGGRNWGGYQGSFPTVRPTMIEQFNVYQ